MQQARGLLASGRPLFLPVAVIEELQRVLRGACAMPAKDIAAEFEDLLLVEHVTVDPAAAVSHALQWHRRGLDFADALHLAPSAPCESLATFDAGLSFSSSAAPAPLPPKAKTRA